MQEQPQNPGPNALTADEVRALNTLAKFGTVHPLGQTDIGRLNRLAAAGYVAKHPKNPTYSLTVRGRAFVHNSGRSNAQEGFSDLLPLAEKRLQELAENAKSPRIRAQARADLKRIAEREKR
jgi:hypothetical protein